MEHREDRRRFTGWTCAGIVIGVAILAGILAAIWFFTPLGKPKPKIQIIQPDNGFSIESGDAVVLKIRGESRNGFNEFQLNVNDRLNNLYKVSDPQQRNQEVSFLWFSSQPGIHKISVIGVNNADISSEPANLLVVVHPRNLSTSSQEANESGLEEIIEPSTQDNEEADVGESGNQSDEEGDPSVDFENEENSSNDVVSGSGQANLDENLDNINLNGDFPLELENGPEDDIPVIDQYEVHDEPNAEGASVSFRVSASDDLGVAFIIFYLSNLDDPLSPDITQLTCGNQTICHIADGFPLGQGSWGLSVQAVDSTGQVSELLSRQVHVLTGDDPHAVAISFLQNTLSNAVFQINPAIQNLHFDLINTVDDIGLPEILRYECSGHSVVLKLNYTYLSDHGDEVFIGAMAENGNNVIAAGHTQINPGSGEAEITMEVITPEMSDLTSEKITLYLRVGGDYFYEKVIDFNKTWPKPLPDLKITYVSQNESFINAQIKNTGCISVQGFDIRFQLADGQILDTHIDHYLAPGITYWLENFFVNANLFSTGFEVFVDPINLITEINENNNSFKLNPISINYIEFYKIDIHNTKEGVWRGPEGEIFLTGRIDDFHFRRPSNTNKVWSLTGGPVDIGGILEPMVFYPTPSPFEGVYIFIRGEEDDDWREEFMGDVHYFLSSDFFDGTTWKRGGDYSATSSEGDFTLYWRIVLNEREN